MCEKGNYCDPRKHCWHCGSAKKFKDRKHRRCENCKKFPPKCWMCRFYDHEELAKEERQQINAGPYRLNSAQCLKCNDIIVSENRHHMIYCKCGALFVDGGSWYSRQGGDPKMIKDLCVLYADVNPKKIYA